MLSVKINTSGALLSGKAPEVIQAGLDRFVTIATQFLANEVQKRTPQGVMGYQGGLISTINSEVTGKGTPLIKGVVFHGSKYGDVVEKGRTAGKGMPPKGSLIRWLEVKLGLSEKEAQRIEFVVRRKIASKGTKGSQMFEKALTDNIGKLEQMAQTCGLAIATELSK